MNYRDFFSRPAPHESSYEKPYKKAQEIKMRPFFVIPTINFFRHYRWPVIPFLSPQRLFTAGK
jgi:hypothetical protein